MSCRAADPDVRFRVVAMSGRPAPGMGSGAVFNNLVLADNANGWNIGPAINAQGRVAFRGDVRVGFGLAGSGILTDAGGSMSLVARDQSPAPGTSINYMSFFPPMLNDAGKVLFVGRLESGPFVTDYGIWSDALGSLTLIAREGDPAPGTGVAFGDLDPQAYSLAFNNHGHVAFEAGLQGAGVTSANDSGIFTDSPGSLTLVAREGSQAGGLPMGVNYADDGSLLTFGYGDTEVLAFATRLSGPGVIQTVNDSALFVAANTNPSLFLRASEGVPGVAGPGVSQIIVTDVRISVPAQVLFVARFREPPTNVTRMGVFWGGSAPLLRLIAADGQPAPGTATTFAANGAFYDLAMNVGSRFVLTGRLANGETGLWTDTSGEFRLLARAGQPAPGAPAGATFNFFQRSAINSQGRIAFPAAVNIPGGNAVNGLWMTDAGGALRQIIRVGDTIDIDPSPTTTDLRVVSDFTFLDTVYARGLSDGNEVALGVRFRDPDPTGFPVTAIMVASIQDVCIADVDDGSATGTPDGGVTIDDLLYFLNLYGTGAAGADVDDGSFMGRPDGGVTIDDLLYYLFRYEQGC